MDKGWQPRTYRFRAWHEVQKKMYSADELGRDQLTLSPDGRGFVNVSGKSIKQSVFLPYMVAQQWTGIVDKNGIEVYEGDIVSAWSQGYKHTGEVRWRDARNRSGCPCYIIYPAFANGEFWHLNGGSVQPSLEVVGNVFETPLAPTTTKST